MKKYLGKAAIFLASAAVVSQPAQACWNNQAVNAAKIMNLNNMLMVSALRCRKGSHNFLAEYNRFVKINSANLSAQHGVVKRHFARMHGAKRSDLALDRFNIGLANSFGAGHPTMDCSALKSVARDANAQKNSLTSLISLAERSAGSPNLPGGRCKLKIAHKK